MSKLTVWCDGSATPETLGCACYCQETGRALVRRFSVVDEVKGRGADWAECKAVELAITELDANLIITDSKEIARLSTLQDWSNNPKAENLARILDLIKQSGKKVTWVPRNHNRVADWLSKCPCDADFQLEPNLMSGVMKQAFLDGLKPEPIADRSNGRVPTYLNTLENASLEEVRNAEDWILDWMRKDSLDWRKNSQQRQDARGEIASLNNEVQRLKAEMKKLHQVNSALDLKLKSLQA